MQHGDIWRGLDRLAAQHGLSPSGLAKRAGLDATAFNKSKRMSRDGRPRWPSTESVARALDAVGAELDEFTALVLDYPGMTVPLLLEADAKDRAAFDEQGMPVTERCRPFRLPDVSSEFGVFAIELTGNAFAPEYQAGQRLILAPDAVLQRANRVMFLTSEGVLKAGALQQDATDFLDVQVFGIAETSRAFARADLAWISRIIWVSQ